MSDIHMGQQEYNDYGRALGQKVADITRDAVRLWGETKAFMAEHDTAARNQEVTMTAAFDTATDDLKTMIRRILYDECTAVVPPQVEAAVERIALVAAEWGAYLASEVLPYLQEVGEPQAPLGGA